MKSFKYVLVDLDVVVNTNSTNLLHLLLIRRGQIYRPYIFIWCGCKIVAATVAIFSELEVGEKPALPKQRLLQCSDSPGLIHCLSSRGSCRHSENGPWCPTCLLHTWLSRLPQMLRMSSPSPSPIAAVQYKWFLMASIQSCMELQPFDLAASLSFFLRPETNSTQS